MNPLLAVPTTSQLFEVTELAARHPSILTVQQIKWALRNRETNGLADCNAVFLNRSGRLLINEPAFIAWFLGLTGKHKPRASRRRIRSRVDAATPACMINEAKRHSADDRNGS